MSSRYNRIMDKSEILKTLGRNIRAERNRLGLSQEALAEKADLSYFTHISKIENGELDTRITTLIAILEALNISFDKIYKLNINKK